MSASVFAIVCVIHGTALEGKVNSGCRLFRKIANGHVPACIDVSKHSYNIYVTISSQEAVR